MADPLPPDALARQKLDKVLGEAKGASLYLAVLKEAGLARLVTPEDLLRFGRALERRGAIAGSIGSLLSVQAVLRGARGT